jgi:hypothetical protein
MMIPRLQRTTLLFLLLAVAGTCFGSDQSKAAFQKIKSLAGEWQGKDSEGMAVNTKFDIVVNGTTVLETLAMSGMEDMLSIYSVDGDAVALVHYCPTNNQPRMRALAPEGEIHELEFIFRDAGNMPVPTAGHQQRIVIHFDDADHITESLTWRQNGNDSVQVMHLSRLSRKKASAVGASQPGRTAKMDHHPTH